MPFDYNEQVLNLVKHLLKWYKTKENETTPSCIDMDIGRLCGEIPTFYVCQITDI